MIITLYPVAREDKNAANLMELVLVRTLFTLSTGIIQEYNTRV